MRVVALTDNVPLITAWANDFGYKDVFVEQLRNLLRPGDISFAISASGNSPNVIQALHYSRAAGAVNLGISGFLGGQMKPLCDLCLVVPSETMQLIEDLHLSHPPRHLHGGSAPHGALAVGPGCLGPLNRN